MVQPARLPGAAWLLAALLIPTLALTDAGPPPKKITVGTLTLKYCNSDYDGYCGSIVRPLDPTGTVRGSIPIGFEY